MDESGGPGMTMRSGPKAKNWKGRGQKLKIGKEGSQWRHFRFCLGGRVLQYFLKNNIPGAENIHHFLIKIISFFDINSISHQI